MNSDKALPIKYYGNIGNEVAFLRYVREKVGDTPLKDIPLAELFANWAMKNGIEAQIFEREDGLGRVIVEGGFKLPLNIRLKDDNPPETY